MTLTRSDPDGALEALYRSRFPDFVRVATAIVGDGERARDAVQDAFVQAVRSRDQQREDASLEAWVWRIVVNAARKSRRSHRDESPLDPTAPAANGHRDDPTAVRAAIAGLSDRQRHVLFLRYYADLDYAAIAEALEIREGTVAATLNRAHAALRPTLEGLR